MKLAKKHTANGYVSFPEILIWVWLTLVGVILIYGKIENKTQTREESERINETFAKIVNKKITDENSPLIEAVKNTKTITYDGIWTPATVGKGLIENNRIEAVLNDPTLGKFAHAIGKPRGVATVTVQGEEIPFYIEPEADHLKSQAETLFKVLSKEAPEIEISGTTWNTKITILKETEILGKKVRLKDGSVSLPLENLRKLTQTLDMSTQEKQKWKTLVSNLEKAQ